MQRNVTATEMKAQASSRHSPNTSLKKLPNLATLTTSANGLTLLEKQHFA